MLTIEKRKLSKRERMRALKAMKAAVDTFYLAAVQTGCHAFIELTGLLAEFVTVCTAAELEGIRWIDANGHGSSAVPWLEHNVRYISEKLGCLGLDIRVTSRPRGPR